VRTAARPVPNTPSSWYYFRQPLNSRASGLPRGGSTAQSTSSVSSSPPSPPSGAPTAAAKSASMRACSAAKTYARAVRSLRLAPLSCILRTPVGACAPCLFSQVHAPLGRGQKAAFDMREPWSGVSYMLVHPHDGCSRPQLQK
jgi:hypothetical protein